MIDEFWSLNRRYRYIAALARRQRKSETQVAKLNTAFLRRFPAPCIGKVRRWRTAAFFDQAVKEGIKVTRRIEDELAL